MYRKIVILLFVCLSAFQTVVRGETVTRKEAQTYAHTFFNAVNGKVMAKPSLVYNGKGLTTDRLFSPFYIFNSPGGGFVIISADNKAFPILGYDLKKSFDPEKMNDGLKALLKRYAMDVEMIRYDSRIPYEAIDSWNDFRGYVASLIVSPVISFDPGESVDEVTTWIDALLDSEEIETMESGLYSPDQWNDILAVEMNRRKSGIKGGYWNGGTFKPALFSGKQGDFFKIIFDQEDGSFFRAQATEFLNGGMIADLGLSPSVEEETEADIPFASYDAFMEDVRREREAYESSLAETLQPTSPVVRSLGGGHFEVFLPENVLMARVYNLQGAQVETLLFRDTNIANVKLDSFPNGFYFLLINGESGKPYGVKLFR